MLAAAAAGMPVLAMHWHRGCLSAACMQLATHEQPSSDLHVQLLDPDMSPEFQDPSVVAFERNSRVQRVVANCDGDLVGCLTYERRAYELRVREIMIGCDISCPPAVVVRALVDALESEGLSGGARHVSFPERLCDADMCRVLRAKGYDAIAMGRMGEWFEKALKASQ